MCNIDGISEPGDTIEVTVSDTICMAGEHQGSDRLYGFTFGAEQGALEALTCRKLKAKHSASRWRGQPEDIFSFTPRL